MTRSSPATEVPPVEDLPLYWQGWANAIRLMDGNRTESDAASLRQAAAYEKCAEELRAALRASQPATPTGGNPVAPEPGWLKPALDKAAQRASEMPDWMTRQPATPTGGETLAGCGTPGCTDPNCEYGKGDDAAAAAARSSAGSAEVLAMLDERIAAYNSLLGELAWRPSRAHIETARNLMVDVAKELRGAAQPPPALWCCHVRGPDDVHAAPDYETALKWADMINAMNWRSGGGVKMPDPASYEECLLKAVPSLWPHSPEAHAEDLPKSMKGFALPSTQDQTP